MTRSQRLAHARIWMVIAVLVAAASAYALIRRDVAPVQPRAAALPPSGTALP